MRAATPAVPVHLRLSFEANRGQADRQVKFLARGQGHTLFLTSSEAVLTLAPPQLAEHEQQGTATLRLRVVGAQPDPVIEALEEIPTRSHYFIGRDPAHWHTDIPHYSRVRVRGIYPGVDQVFHAAGGDLEYDFVVNRGADPSRIRVAFDGVNAMRVNDANDLVLGIGKGEIEQRVPRAYQEIDGVRRVVAARYVITGAREAGFEIAPYDRTRPLVIDPVIVYSTYLGGSSSEAGQSVATDRAANMYVTGYTWSADFPTVSPLQPALHPNGRGVPRDAFVSKIDPTGTRLVYSTYFGGDDVDSGYGIAVDAAGSAYVTGLTYSADLPVVNALQTARRGIDDAFAVKLNPAGSALVYSTYLGGSGGDEGRGIAVDAAGRAHIAGTTYSNDFPLANAWQSARRGVPQNPDVFVSKLDASGMSFVYSTYLGGTGVEEGHGIALDAGGNAYLTGVVSGSGGDFPTLNARQPVPGGLQDAFVAKFSLSGSLLYSTYLGGSDVDIAKAIAVTPDGRTYVTGSTRSLDFPTINAQKPANGQPTVYKSMDSGRSWHALGLDNYGIASIAVDRLTPSTVYAATRGKGVFKSTDGGAHWNAINTGLGSVGVNVVAADPFMPHTVWAGTTGNLFKSSDGGNSWTRIAADTFFRPSVFSLAFDPVRPQSIYAGVTGTIGRTQDGGTTWAYGGPAEATAIAVDPSNPLTVYAGSMKWYDSSGGVGISKTTDGGATWVAINSGLSPPGARRPTVSALVIDPRAPSILYAAASDVFKSTNAGATWTAMNNGVSMANSLHPVPTSLVIDPLNSSVLYLGTAYGGVFKTSDGGASWTAMNNGLLHLTITALAVSPTERGTIYAGTIGGSSDAFLASLSADGSSVLYSTFLGGGGDDYGNGVAVDTQGNAYVTGWTNSIGFPTVDAFQARSGGGNDGFVAAFTAAGTARYASYIGGSGSDFAQGIAVDTVGNVFVTGYTESTDFPVKAALQPTRGGGFATADAFVLKIGAVALSSSDAIGSTDAVMTTSVVATPSAMASALPSPSASGVFTTRDGVRFRVETVASDLDSPWAMAFAPEGRLFVAERAGSVRIFDAALRSSSVALMLGDVFARGEAGLLGLALDPAFATNRFVYLYYTTRIGASAVNRVVRYRESGGRLIERVVLLDNIPANTMHNGGQLRFGPDDLLYITTGDAGVPSLAQDLASYAGKILRVNRDGLTPRGNPYSTPILSAGHRNPQGIDWHPVTGDLWSDENAGASFDRGRRIPAFANDFFVATLQEDGLLRIRVDAASPKRMVDAERLVDGRFGRLRGVTSGPDGFLYFFTSDGREGLSGDRLLRIVPR
jgi:glucose/arabinose dehydrogenase/photosystem II stability/assembly factor-like uncharacterized protein